MLEISNRTLDLSIGLALILSEFGRIEGEVKVPNMVLNGEIVGDVYGSTRVELAPKSRIKGSVYYNLIEMAWSTSRRAASCRKGSRTSRPTAARRAASR